MVLINSIIELILALFPKLLVPDKQIQGHIDLVFRSRHSWGRDSTRCKTDHPKEFAPYFTVYIATGFNLSETFSDKHGSILTSF